MVRVGANAVASPRAASHGVFPVIQIISPPGEVQYPKGSEPIWVRWQMGEGDTKESSSPSARFLGICRGTDPTAHFTYRCPPSDKYLFEQLRNEWGMWFFSMQEVGGTPSWYTVFNDGSYFSMSIAEAMIPVIPKLNAKQLRDALVSNFDKALAAIGGPSNEEQAYHQKRAIARIPDVLELIGGGPLPWDPKKLDSWGRVDKREHKWFVQQYLMVCENFQHALETNVSNDVRLKMQHMLALLRRANIIEVSPQSYIDLHLDVDRYVTEEVCNLTYHHPHAKDPAPWDVIKAEGAILTKRQPAALAKLPFPEKFPFDVCWFATSALLSPTQKGFRGLDPKVDTLLVGILADEAGELHEVVTTGKETWDGFKAKHYQVVTHTIKDVQHIEDGRWLHKMSLTPWILHRMVDCINDHRTVVLGKQPLNMSERKEIKRVQKKLKLRKPAPPPWYVVHLRDKVLHETPRRYGDFAARHLSCRFTVRGHHCYKIYRGELPMDPEFELKLENRGGYKFYKNNPLDAWALDVFHDRRLSPKGENEWVAIKEYWRDKFVKGPEDAPFVPSTRRATKGDLAWKD